MSSRVGTAMPASRSTARSSSGVGLTRSTHTAVSGRDARSTEATFFSEASQGTYTESIKYLQKLSTRGFPSLMGPEPGSGFGLDAFSSREPASASLENALTFLTRFLHANRYPPLGVRRQAFVGKRFTEPARRRPLDSGKCYLIPALTAGHI